MSVKSWNYYDRDQGFSNSCITISEEALEFSGLKPGSDSHSVDLRWDHQRLISIRFGIEATSKG